MRYRGEMTRLRRSGWVIALLALLWFTPAAAQQGTQGGGAYLETAFVCKDEQAAQQANAIADRLYRNKIAVDGANFSDYGAQCSTSRFAFTVNSFTPIESISRRYKGYLSATSADGATCSNAGLRKSGPCVPCLTSKGQQQQCVLAEMVSVFVPATAHVGDRHVPVVVELPANVARNAIKP